MLDYRGAGFTKLEDFWDRHLYNGNPAALDADTNGGSDTLGLAEFCNGNFLGARHLYPEYYQPGDISYYPYPSRNTSTDYLQKRANLLSGVNNLVLKNGQPAKAIYLKKTGDGISMDYHSRFTFFGGRFPYFGMITINDHNVLSNYHDVLIPKAVAYSAGLLDYFFRGTLGVGVSNKLDGTWELSITNTSSQDFYGGGFCLFFDDDIGDRAEITNGFTTTYSGSLASGNAITATLTPTNADSYILVYRGTIGTSNNAPLDPVDDGLAIAVKKFGPPCGSLPTFVANVQPSSICQLNNIAVQSSNETSKVVLAATWCGGHFYNFDVTNNFAPLTSTTLSCGECPFVCYAPGLDKFIVTDTGTKGACGSGDGGHLLILNPQTLAVEQDISDFTGSFPTVDPVSGRLYAINYFYQINTFDTTTLSVGPSSPPLADWNDYIEGFAIKNTNGQFRVFCAITAEDFWGSYPEGGTTGYVKMYDGASMQPLVTYQLPGSGGFSAAFDIVYCPDNDCLYVAGVDTPYDWQQEGQQAQVVWVLNASTGQLKNTIRIPFPTYYSNPFPNRGFFVPSQREILFNISTPAEDHVIAICTGNNSIAGTFDNAAYWSGELAMVNTNQLIMLHLTPQMCGSERRSAMDLFTY